MRQADIRRISYGHFVRPASETGTGFARVEPTLGYAVRYTDGVILFDTGLAEADPETAEHYRPYRRTPIHALADAGIELDDVRWIVNSHLHFDHCGGNSFFPDRPIVAQRVELESAKAVDYTVPSAIEFDGARYEIVDGETYVIPDVLVVPTPGHTDGHQSLVVECNDGAVVCAGQATEFSFELGGSLLAQNIPEKSLAGVSSAPQWLSRLLEFDPRRIVFAHDLSVLEL
jgi:N-acyl homoserine lactone hydrolase